MSISDAQCRAARALLGLSQSNLAEISGVSQRTIAGFESGNTTPINANLQALQRALEEKGAMFIENGSSSPNGGAGVRLSREIVYARAGKMRAGQTPLATFVDRSKPE